MPHQPPEVLTVAELAELERLHEAATAGPWRNGNGHGLESHFWNVYSGASSRDDGLVARGMSEDCDENAVLIVATRNALPALLASARRLLELRSAAGHLEAHGAALAFLEHGHIKPGSFTADLLPEDIIEAARELGWPGLEPTRKETP